MPDAKPLRADAQRNRDAIVTAARAAFERGESDLRFDDFATLAGVGTGTLYRHFPTRAALIDAVYREEVDALCAHAEQLVADLPPTEALATFLHGFVTHLIAHEGLARTLATLARNPGEAQTAGGQALEQAVTLLVTAASRGGDQRSALTPGAVMTALHGIGASVGRSGWRDDARALVDLVIAAP